MGSNEWRTSQRIIDKEISKAVGVEENRLILSGGRLLQRSPSGGLILFSNLSTKRLYWHHGRFYHKTGEGYYIFDTGAHNGDQEQAEKEDPDPEHKAIKLYYHKGKIYCWTRNGELVEDNKIQQEISNTEEEDSTTTTEDRG